jgi:hypothetical protein
MRTWTEIVKAYPELVRGKHYKVRVKEISKVARPKALAINLEFLEAPQQGRRLAALLPLPIRPDSLAADFFAACHLAVTPEAKIAPRDVTHAVLAASFERTADGQDWQPINFEGIRKGDDHDPECQP